MVEALLFSGRMRLPEEMGTEAVSTFVHEVRGLAQGQMFRARLDGGACVSSGRRCGGGRRSAKFVHEIRLRSQGSGIKFTRCQETRVCLGGWVVHVHT